MQVYLSMIWILLEVEGYRAIRDLDQNSWQGRLEEVDELWRDTVG